MKQNTRVFALTGNMGTGKSTVAWMFSELGVPVINADEIAHDALVPKTQVWEKLYKRYGKDILLKDNLIDRKVLANIIFESPTERKYVESLIHPHVRDEIGHRLAKLAKEKAAHVIVEIPLLFEVGWENEFDAVIVVKCNELLELKRIRDKFGLTKQEALARISAQLPIQRKIKAADAVIDNDGELEETKVQVTRLYKEMLSGKFPTQVKKSKEEKKSLSAKILEADTVRSLRLPSRGRRRPSAKA